MSADAVQHRVLARRIESRADSRELDGRAYESLAQAFTVRREILTVPFGIDVTHGAIFATVIDELRGENIADAQRHTVLEDFLVYDGESIARLDVEHEVDVVLENIREIESNPVREFRVRRRLEEGVLDSRTGSSRANLERILEHIAAEAIRVPGHLEGFAVRQLPLESDEFPAAVHEAQQFARLQPIDLAPQLRQIAQAREVAEVQLEAAKKPVHRVIPADHHLDGRETEARLMCCHGGLDGWCRRDLRRGPGGERRCLAIARQRHEGGDNRDQPDLQQVCGPGR